MSVISERIALLAALAATFGSLRLLAIQVGREDVIGELLCILARRSKRNCVLVGEVIHSVLCDANRRARSTVQTS